MNFSDNSQAGRRHGDAGVSLAWRSPTGGVGTPLWGCDRGFTLIEIILTVVLISIVGTVGVQYVTSLAQVNQANSEQTRLVEEARIGMGFLTRELRDADISVRCGPGAVDCVVGTAYSRVVLDKLLPANPAPRDPNGNDIVYALNVGTNMLERTSNGVTTQVTSGITGLSITEIFPNLYRIQMTMTGPGGGNFALDSAVRVRSSINPPTSTSLQVALVVRNPGNLDVNRDVPVLTYMQSNLQHIVTLKDDNDQTWDPVVDGYSAVVISSSVLRRKVGWLAPFNVGILTLHGNTFNTFSLGTGGATFGPVNSTDIVVQNPTHYIMQVPPFSSGGTHTIYTNADNSGHMQGWSNGVTALATHQPNATRGRLLVVDAGALLVNGNPAPSRRAYFAARFFANLNTDGQELFKRSLEWVTQ